MRNINLQFQLKLKDDKCIKGKVNTLSVKLN